MVVTMMLDSSKWILSSGSRTDRAPHSCKSSTLSLSHTIKIAVKESTLVRPKEETPSGSLRLSNLDLIMPDNYHSRFVYFFRPNGAANFFDAAVLKAALSRALVDFYPFAGRLRMDNDGRLEVNCSGEGVVFVEAECDGTMEELRGFAPRTDVSLVPKVDYSQGISNFPLSLFQLTRFKCGGVSLGVANDHHVADGTATLHYINTWSDISRGDLTATKPPVFDRQLLSARNPPQPQYQHVEYQPFPSLKTPLDITDTSFRTFKLTADQIQALKLKCNSGGRNYSTYEAIAGHVWRSVCLARQLPHDQETKLRLPVNGRPRLRPRLPRRFFGNGIFYATALTTCGEMESNPVRVAVGKVHEAVARMDGDYMRSALDYLELQLPESKGSASSVKCPNFGITTWVRMPLYQTDFGWGKPIFAGPGEPLLEGKSFVVSDPENEGGMVIAITLLKPHMELFQDLIYHI